MKAAVLLGLAFVAPAFADECKTYRTAAYEAADAAYKAAQRADREAASDARAAALVAKVAGSVAALDSYEAVGETARTINEAVHAAHKASVASYMTLDLDHRAVLETAFEAVLEAAILAHIAHDTAREHAVHETGPVKGKT